MRAVWAAVIAQTLAVLPAMLVGGFAVVLGPTLRIGPMELGLAVASFFAAGAAAAPMAGRLTQRFGSRAAAVLGLACAAASLLGMATIANGWIVLIACLALGGLGNTFTLLATSLAMLDGIPAHRRGFALGLLQASFPLASLLTGLAIPFILFSFDWQGLFLGAALLATFVAVAVPIHGSPPRVAKQATRKRSPVAMRLLALGMGSAAAGGTAAPAFTVISAVDKGVTASEAGLLLAAGSLAAVCVRIGGGRLADLRGRGSWAMVGVLLCLGAAGYVGLAVSDDPAHIVVFTLAAFAGGWGWPGLFALAVAQDYPDAPGEALGVALLGGHMGAVFGPIGFGLVQESVSLSAAWIMMAALAGLAAAAFLVARRRLGEFPPSPVTTRWNR